MRERRTGSEVTAGVTCGALEQQPGLDSPVTDVAAAVLSTRGALEPMSTHQQAQYEAIIGTMMLELSGDLIFSQDSKGSEISTLPALGDGTRKLLGSSSPSSVPTPLRHELHDQTPDTKSSACRALCIARHSTQQPLVAVREVGLRVWA